MHRSYLPADVNVFQIQPRLGPLGFCSSGNFTNEPEGSSLRIIGDGVEFLRTSKTNHCRKYLKCFYEKLDMDVRAV